MHDGDNLDLGTCCVCGKEDSSVRNIVALPFKSLIPGLGWRCFQCGLSMDGAVTVLCDACIDSGKADDIKEVIYGYPLEKKRHSYELLTEEFNHDPKQHKTATDTLEV